MNDGGFRFGSTFSGIGGIDLGLERAGMRAAWQAESDEWCRGILGERFPGIPCYADVRDVGGDDVGSDVFRERLDGDGGSLPVDPRGVGHERQRDSVRVDLLCGGFPCQDLSVAGKRAGLAGARSGLFHEFARIADAIRPAWLLLENVPGLLSSNDGRDFGVLLGTLAELGYGVAWRTLDSRYFGVAQRRRRVFIVGHLGGDGTSALRALCESCEGHPPASVCSWQESPAGAQGGTRGDGEPDDGRRYYIEDGENQTLKAGGAGGSPPRSDRLPLLVAPLAHALSSRNTRLSHDQETFVEAFALQPDDQGETPGALRGVQVNVAPTIGTGDHHSDRGTRVVSESRVRRLTPRECERLQSFPDDWSLVESQACPDSRRYGAIGNAVTVNVAEWIGRRIVAAHAADQEEGA